MNKPKLSAVLILIVYILIAVSCSGNTKNSVQTEQNKEVSVLEVSIGGMSCTGCEQTIQNNVGKLEGIKSVKATYTTGIAMIEYYDGITDTAVIKEAINGSGYTVKKFIIQTKQGGEK
ncbi:MAG: heavy-metal-associated domain-containing protein [Bacteroidales bacterium]|nr:heavy-metal-associated domain-containing protein [Bacteroidales bacterium]